MTEIPYYKCDICGEVYKRKEDAEACEKSHVDPVAVRGYFPKGRNMNGEAYGKPYNVIVTMSDGTEYEYVYSGPKGAEGKGDA